MLAMDYINEFNTSHYYIFQSIHFPVSGQRFFFFLLIMRSSPVHINNCLTSIPIGELP